MTRWFTGTRKRSDSGEVETPKADAFLNELEALCAKHGFSIGHEDTGGAFILSRYDDPSDMRWIRAAMIDATVKADDR